jgi:hypothetical protein
LKIRSIGLALGLTCALSGQSLRIEILRGTASNNNAGAGSAVAPAVRITDNQGKPVSGALVIFTAPSAGPSVDFAGDGPVAHSETDQSGIAVSPHIRPVAANGPLEIEVVAEKSGDSARVSLFQMNLGVDSVSATFEDLDVTLVAIAGPPRKGVPGHASLQVVRSTGGPAADAQVECTVRSAKPSGEFEELLFSATRSNDAGAAVCDINGKAGPNVELVVRATLSARSATRYFKLNQRF